MRKVWLFVATLCSLVNSSCRGQEHRASTQSSFPNVHLQIGAKAGGNTFRIGEAIRLDLLFTASGPPQLNVLHGFNRRHETLDNVAVEPSSGWEDPLADFYRLCPPYSMGGMLDDRLLSSDPEKIPLILNELIRFESPGDYIITVDSRRVTSVHGSRNSEQSIVKSDKFRLHIVPASKDWQSRTLDDALRVLNSAEGMSRGQIELRGDAIDSMRFLGTDEAAQAMARLLASEYFSAQLLDGLVGSPARETVAREMRRLLVDPHFPVVREFPCALSIVENPAAARAGAVALQSQIAASLREELRAVLKYKIGQAQKISSVTVDRMR